MRRDALMTSAGLHDRRPPKCQTVGATSWEGEDVQGMAKTAIVLPPSVGARRTDSRDHSSGTRVDRARLSR